MGFIEERRKQLQKSESLKRQQSLAEKDRQEKLMQEMNRADVEKKRLKILAEEAKRRFQQSGLGEMLIASRLIGPNHFFYTGRGLYECTIVVDEKSTPYKDPLNKGTVKVKLISIETTSDGEIKFKGGFLGSSIVEQNIWEKDKAALERALGKAYHHPKAIRYENSSPSSGSGEPGIG